MQRFRRHPDLSVKTALVAFYEQEAGERARNVWQSLHANGACPVETRRPSNCRTIGNGSSEELKHILADVCVLARR